jgi:hypothetical protein
LRLSLAEFLAGEVDPVVTMKMLQHKRLATTAEIYIHHVTKKQQAAQGLFLKAIGKNEGRTKRKKEGKWRSRVGSRVEMMLMKRSKLLINMVGTTGFEPATSSVSRNATNRMLLTVQ